MIRNLNGYGCGLEGYTNKDGVGMGSSLKSGDGFGGDSINGDNVHSPYDHLGIDDWEYLNEDVKFFFLYLNKEMVV